MTTEARIVQQLEIQAEGVREARGYATRRLPHGVSYWEGWKDRAVALETAIREGMLNASIDGAVQGEIQELKLKNKLLTKANKELRAEVKEHKKEAIYHQVVRLVSEGRNILSHTTHGRQWYRIKGKKLINISPEMMKRLEQEGVQLNLLRKAA